jgi:hypothetical protein
MMSNRADFSTVMLASRGLVSQAHLKCESRREGISKFDYRSDDIQRGAGYNNGQAIFTQQHLASLGDLLHFHQSHHKHHVGETPCHIIG